MTGPPAGPGIIFDVDGLLIDTEPVWRRAETEVFGELGIELTEADGAETMGVRIDEVVAHWRARRPWPGAGGPPDDHEIAGRIVDLVIAHVRERGEPQPGVAAAFAAARAVGAVALASSSPPALIDAICDRLGLSVAVRCSAVDEPWGKPAPDVYLTAARRLGVAPARCVALEDSPNGVRSALAAGMPCLAVPDPFVAADPAFARARLLTSLEEVTPDLLRSMLPR